MHFIGCFSLCYPGYSARLALTNGFPPQKGFNHGGISVKLHGFANHYRYAMQTSLFFFTVIIPTYIEDQVHFWKVVFFITTHLIEQFYENAGIVFFEEIVGVLSEFDLAQSIVVRYPEVGLSIWGCLGGFVRVHSLVLNMTFYSNGKCTFLQLDIGMNLPAATAYKKWMF